jgi:hypothetical protein
MQLMSGVPWETVTLTTLSRDRTLFPQLLSEARDLAMRGQEGKLVIHTAWGIEWKPFGLPRRKRPLQSVVLEPGVGEKIEQDIKSFLDRRQWYADRGKSPSPSSCFLHVLTSLRSFRNSISSGILITWSSRFRENFFYSSPSWLSFL